MGLWNTKDTRDEATLCLKQLKASPTDKVFTLYRADCVFNVYDQREFLNALSVAKMMGATLLKGNIFEREFGEEGNATLFVLSPPKTDGSFCPLALACGVMVSGFSYITRDKSIADVAWRYLGSKE
jgi:hypothetical protein